MCVDVFDTEEEEESASAAAGSAMEVAPSSVITASYYSKDVPGKHQFNLKIETFLLQCTYL